MSLWKRQQEPNVDKPEPTFEDTDSETTDLDTLPTLEAKHSRLLDDFNDLFEDSKEEEYYYCRACKVRFKTLKEAEEHEETPDHFAKEETWKTEYEKFYTELREERIAKKLARKEARLRRRQARENKSNAPCLKKKKRKARVKK